MEAREHSQHPQNYFWIGICNYFCRTKYLEYVREVRFYTPVLSFHFWLALFVICLTLPWKRTVKTLIGI